jgi:hypothetical protein
MENGTVTIVNPLTGKLEIEVAMAYGRREKKREIQDRGGYNRQGGLNRRTDHCAANFRRTSLSQQNQSTGNYPRTEEVLSLCAYKRWGIMLSGRSFH